MNKHENDILSKTLEMLDTYSLCTNCLGRLFGMLGTGLSNKERGEALIITLLIKADEKIKNNKIEEGGKILQALFNICNFPQIELLAERSGIKIEKRGEQCYICDDIFLKLEEEVEDSIRALQDYEFNKYLVGTKIDSEIIEREDNFRAKFKLGWGESIKSELNREIGKIIDQKITNIEVDFKNPHIVIEYSIPKFTYEIKVNPIFLYGRYRKLIRGIPQTKWFCKSCMGKGCEKCNYKGKMYETSIEEIISKPVLEELKGEETKFHGAGREDIDAVMLGDGRPFVLEIKGVKKRTIDLKSLEEKINKSANKKVEVQNLKWVNKETVRKIKALSKIIKKTYRAIVELQEDITEEDIKKIEEKFTDITIEQRTPKRVVHRRGDRIREKQVYHLKVKKISKKKIEAIIEGQGGLYIKELINGDEGRTTPSISEILGIEASCVQLDVLKVDFPEEIIEEK
ncbi:MAG: tRNA pseudouridine(54/55) synthase Pus10 [Candidatus Odinarchaeia archaeon]